MTTHTLDRTKSNQADVLFLVVLITILASITFLFMLLKFTRGYLPSSANTSPNYDLTETRGEIV